jgi:hypothetical protein
MKKLFTLTFVILAQSAFAFQSVNEISGSFSIAHEDAIVQYDTQSDLGSFTSEENLRKIATKNTEVHYLAEYGVSGSFEVID